MITQQQLKHSNLCDGITCFPLFPHRKQLGLFGEEMATFLHKGVIKYLKANPYVEVLQVFAVISPHTHTHSEKIGTASVTMAFNSELKNQLSALIEKRWFEIGNFQLMMELDFEKYVGCSGWAGGDTFRIRFSHTHTHSCHARRVCEEVSTVLEKQFIKAREAASAEAGRQIGQYCQSRDEQLKGHTHAVKHSFENIRHEVRCLLSVLSLPTCLACAHAPYTPFDTQLQKIGEVHERSKSEVAEKVQNFVEQHAQEYAAVLGRPNVVCAEQKGKTKRGIKPITLVYAHTHTHRCSRRHPPP